MFEDPPYCVAAVGHDVEPKTKLDSWDAVLSHLRETYVELAKEYADGPAQHEAAEPEAVPLGGFGIWLRNRRGSEVEVGVSGGDVWFLFRLRPKPARYLSDHPPIAGRLADSLGLEVTMYIQGAMAIGAGLIAMFIVETNPRILARRRPAEAAA